VSLVALGALATVHEHTPAALARSSVCCEVLLVTSACAMSQVGLTPSDRIHKSNTIPGQKATTGHKSSGGWELVTQPEPAVRGGSASLGAALLRLLLSVPAVVEAATTSSVECLFIYLRCVNSCIVEPHADAWPAQRRPACGLSLPPRGSPAGPATHRFRCLAAGLAHLTSATLGAPARRHRRFDPSPGIGLTASEHNQLKKWVARCRRGGAALPVAAWS
jgi:hypothetical protein